LGASVDIAGRDGRRTVGANDFFLGAKRSAVAAGELVVAVRVSVRRGPQDYLKVGVRNAMVIAVASLAIAVDLDARSVGVGLGAVGPATLTTPDACAWIASRARWRADGVRVEAHDAAAFAAM